MYECAYTKCLVRTDRHYELLLHNIRGSHHINEGQAKTAYSNRHDRTYSNKTWVKMNLLEEKDMDFVKATRTKKRKAPPEKPKIQPSAKKGKTELECSSILTGPGLSAGKTWT